MKRFTSILILIVVMSCLHAKPASPGTVVLVHGFIRTANSMSPLSYSFKQNGWKTVKWGYKSKQKNIEEHASDLVVDLKQIAQKNPNEPISFVTHSMGGVIVRCALNHPECPVEAKMGRAALIAPPNKGASFGRHLGKSSLLKKIAGKNAGNQLMSGSVDDFEKFGDFPEQMPVLIVSGTAGFNPLIPGKNDGTVGVHESCLKTHHYHARVFAGHTFICHKPKVIRRVHHFLSSPLL